MHIMGFLSLQNFPVLGKSRTGKLGNEVSGK